MSANSAPPATAEPERIAALDGLRGVAILLVLMMHARLVPQGIDVAPTGFDQGLLYVLSFGWAGVDLFFVLSGYLITGILLRTRERPHYFRNFYARRTLRIFPLYYCVVLLRLYAFPTAGGYAGVEQISYLTYWSNFWQIANPAARGHDDFVLVTWSLAIEEQFYLVWPLIVFLCGRRRLLFVAAGLVVAAPVLRAVLQANGTDHWALYVASPCRLDALALGAVIAVLDPRPGPRARWFALLAAGIAAVALAMVFAADTTVHYGARMQTIGYSANALLGGACIALAVSSPAFGRICANGLLRLFGRYSYAIYLLHLPVIGLASWLLLRVDSPLSLLPIYRATGMHAPGWLLLFVACAGLSLLAGVASWHLLERHFLALKERYSNR